MTSEGVCKVVALAAGSAHSVALLDNGMVVTWGRGEDGQLGHGVTQDMMSPTVVASLLGVKIEAIQCGAEFTIAWSTVVHQLYGWGQADSGNLDTESKDLQLLPEPMQYFQQHEIVSVGCGDGHTAVVNAQRELYTFGNNQNGQLGVGHNRDCYMPQFVSYLKNRRVCQVACGAEHCAAVTQSGEVFVWGCGLSSGINFDVDDSSGRSQLIRSPEIRWVPKHVTGLEGVFATQVVCGWRHNLVLSSCGQLFVWGWNCYGQLGTGDTIDRQEATRIIHPEYRRWVIIAAGWRTSAAVDDTGHLYVWGWNKFGQLGLGHYIDQKTPTNVSTLADKQVRLLSCGWRHTMAVTTDDSFYVWGRGSYGRLGLGHEMDALSPQLLPQLSQENLRPSQLLYQPFTGKSHAKPSDSDFFAVPGSQSTQDNFFHSYMISNRVNQSNEENFMVPHCQSSSDECEEMVVPM